jgi:hypothetical protein
MEKILGLDISSGYATAFFLEGKPPADPNEFVAGSGFNYFEIHSNRDDLEKLIALDFDIAVLEPSGYHYEKLICTWLEKAGKQYHKVAGWRLADYRSSIGLSEKTDPIDAFSLACYGYEKQHQRNAFIPKTELEEVRQLWLQRQQLIRIQNRQVQRLKQQLAHEFPEGANFTIDRAWGEPPHGFINWLAGERIAPSRQTWYDTRLNGGTVRTSKPGRPREKVEGTIGVGLSAYGRFLGQQIYQLEEEQFRLELTCNEILAEERFIPYIEAFQRLGMSQNVQTIWLTRIYPFERFLEDGKPRISKKLSGNGKEVKKDRSLGQFKASLGAAKRRDTSGTRQVKDDSRFRGSKWRGKIDEKDRPAEIPIGDPFCRKAFFMWSLSQIEAKHAKGELSHLLFAKRDELKAKGKNLFQRSGNLHGYAARLLYRELLKTL